MGNLKNLYCTSLYTGLKTGNSCLLSMWLKGQCLKNDGSCLLWFVNLIQFKLCDATTGVFSACHIRA